MNCVKQTLWSKIQVNRAHHVHQRKHNRRTLKWSVRKSKLRWLQSVLGSGSTMTYPLRHGYSLNLIYVPTMRSESTFWESPSTIPTSILLLDSIDPLSKQRILIQKLIFLAKLLQRYDGFSLHIFRTLGSQDVYEVSLVQPCHSLKS